MNYVLPSTTIAGEIRAEMARQMVSPPALADKANIPLPTLRRRLAGDTNLTIDELAKIATCLGVSITSFIPQRGEAA